MSFWSLITVPACLAVVSALLLLAAWYEQRVLPSPRIRVDQAPVDS